MLEKRLQRAYEEGESASGVDRETNQFVGRSRESRLSDTHGSTTAGRHVLMDSIGSVRVNLDAVTAELTSEFHRRNISSAISE